MIQLRLAAYAVSIAVKAVWIGANDLEAAIGDIATVEIGRRRRDADTWIRGMAVVIARRRGWCLRLDNRLRCGGRGGSIIGLAADAVFVRVEAMWICALHPEIGVRHL
jgi:hypothetical protein